MTTSVDLQPSGRTDLSVLTLIGTATLVFAAAPSVTLAAATTDLTVAAPYAVVELAPALTLAEITVATLTPRVLLEIAGGAPGPAGPEGPAQWQGHEPLFTWAAGKLTRIDYNDGSHKALSYNLDGTIAVVDHVQAGGTLRKTFAWAAGLLQSITEEVLP